MSITLKKFLSVVVSVFILIGILPMSAFAADANPKGIAITDAAGFAAMTANGDYYLANDITVTATYTEVFSGTFNGNGKTITTTTPLFDKVMDATVENFTVTSNSVVTFANGGGMVCNKAGGNTILKNIKNTVSMRSTNAEKDHSLAGIVGDLALGAANSTVTIYGCVNEGNISANEKKGNAGGIVGGAAIETGTYSVVVDGCSNFGNIVGKKSGGVVCLFDKLSGSVTLKNCQNFGRVDAKNDLAGGVIGQVTKSISKLKIYNCLNFGDISTTNKYVAGIIGICQMTGSEFKVDGEIHISSCYNSGKISSTNTACYSGGIAGRVYGALIEYCGNAGEISGGKHVAGIIGGVSTGVHTIRYCYNVGSVSGHSYCAGINALSALTVDEVYGCYNSGNISFIQDTTAPKTIAQIVTVYGNNTGWYHDNYYHDDIKYTNPALDMEMNVSAWAKGWEALNDGSVAYKADDLTSGKLAYDMNTALDATVYFQNLSNTPDANPSLDSARGTVVKSGDKYLSIAIATDTTAAVKLDAASGLKFNTTINKNDYDALIASGISADSISYGTVITFKSYVDAVKDTGKNFTMADFDEAIVGGTAYINDIGVNMIADGDSYNFSGSVINVEAKNYSREYCAVGYLKIGDIIVYSANYATRSIVDVAEAAYEDRADAQNGIYTNIIAANSAHAINATASYSAYTEAQLAVLKSLYTN